jgi:predicted RNA binding protein YcfA (HicA-like mRNA interferase family)
MTKLPRDLKAKKLIRALTKIGFEKVGQRGSHIRLKHADGRWTQVAVHQKPLPQGTLRAILRQANLTTKELEKLV